MQACLGERGRERAHFDQASAILDSNSEEAWGEMKMHPSEWDFPSQYGSEFMIASSNTKTQASLQAKRESFLTL